MKGNINGSGHVTKMAAMVINTKTLFFRTERPMILKLCEAYVNGALQNLYKP